MFNSPAGGAGELFSSPAKGFVEISGGGGGGSGLDSAAVQVLIDASLGSSITPSSVSTAGAVVSSTAFSFDAGNDGEESKIEREANGGLLVKRGGLTFISFSPFTGATFGVNLTTGNLTVNGTLTPPSGGISGFYSSAAVDNLLSAKQNTITTNSLAISNVASLQSSLDAKQSLLSDQSGTGVTLRDGAVMRRCFGENGISVTVPINTANANDPENSNLKIDGSALQTSIATKQDAITNGSSLSMASLTAGTDITASLVKAPANSSIIIGNSAGTGMHVASNGAVGILKVPTEALDV